MNRRDEDSEIVGLEEVSRAYAEAGFDETPPERLDQAITAGAKRRRGQGARFWLSPAHIAWAAALVLSLSIVLQFGMAPRFDSGGEQSIEGTADLPAESGADTAGRDGAGSALSDSSQRLQSAPRRASAPATPDDNAMPPTTRRSAPAPEATSESAAASFQASRALAQSDAAAGAGASTDACPQSDRAAAESWLACLVRLRSEGDGDSENIRARTFENELAAFKERYPDRALPAELELELP